MAYPLGRPLGPFKISDRFSKIMVFAVWATPWPRKGDPDDPKEVPWLPKGAQEPPRSTLDPKMTSKYHQICLKLNPIFIKI